MNNPVIQTYLIEDEFTRTHPNYRKIRLIIDFEELEKHPELYTEEQRNFLRLVYLAKYRSVDLKSTYEYAKDSDFLKEIVDDMYNCLKDLMGKDVADAAKNYGVLGYERALNKKINKIAEELVNISYLNKKILVDKITRVVTLLRHGKSIKTMVKETNLSYNIVKIILAKIAY